jgi:hypothetical protein
LSETGPDHKDFPAYIFVYCFMVKYHIVSFGLILQKMVFLKRKKFVVIWMQFNLYHSENGFNNILSYVLFWLYFRNYDIPSKLKRDEIIVGIKSLYQGSSEFKLFQVQIKIIAKKLKRSWMVYYEKVDKLLRP